MLFLLFLYHNKYILVPESKVNRNTLRSLRKFRNVRACICKAPFSSMSIGFEGKVSPCCFTQLEDQNIGFAKYPDQNLINIWNGKYFTNFRKLIKSNQLPISCKICAEKLKEKEFHSLKTEEYSKYHTKAKFPSIIEIAVDNTCNLECIMCSSEYSSCIAKANSIPTRTKFNLNNLFDELKQFIPHLQDMIFSGGEPILSNFYYKVWEYILDVNPNCNITLNTNASILPKRFKELIEKGRFHFNVSIDSMNTEVYEKIRKNAKLEQTLENYKYLKKYCNRKETSLSTAICPLTLNYHTFPELVKYCNDHDITLFFVHVFQAFDVSLSYASSYEIEHALKIFKSIKQSSKTKISIQNSSQVFDLVKRCEVWLKNALTREEIIKSLKNKEKNYLIHEKNFVNSINKYLNNNNYNTAFKTKITDKLDLIIHKAPSHTKNSKNYTELLKYPTSLIIKQIQNKTERELLWQIETIFIDNFLL